MAFRNFTAVAGLAASLVSASAAEPVPGKFDALVKNSPFGSGATAGGPAGQAGTALELRGVLVDQGEYFFSVHDPASRTSQWVGMKESGQPYLVESYDEAAGTVQVKFRNQSMTLALKRSQILVQAPPPVAPQAGAPSPAAVTASPMAPDEAARLAQIAEEIRRRRAIRAQASGGQLPGPQPQPVPQNSPSPNPNRP